jgi:serine/threonine protein kinase
LLASEARLLARFKHLHIIRVLDFGKHEDTVYLAQEYVRTGSLRQHYPQGTQLSQKIILGYIKQIAETLYYLHGLKVLHRHLKPEHLLLAPGNRVVLCGFGQAFSPWEEDNTTAIKGSRTYMAPEQFQQTSLPASDQYALAAITYEWFCGEPPFTGSPSELEAQHQHTPPPSMVEKRIKLSPAIEQAVLLALAKEPQHRFANVNAFAHALEQACVEGS